MGSRRPLSMASGREARIEGVVGRGNEVDIMAAHFLEPDMTRAMSEGSWAHPFQVADVVILAENTTKVAVGEEDGP